LKTGGFQQRFTDVLLYEYNEREAGFTE